MASSYASIIEKEFLKNTMNKIARLAFYAFGSKKLLST